MQNNVRFSVSNTIHDMPARGSYAKGVAKREEILTTALEVISREGYRGASIRELADAAGLSQAGILHYFGSKEELFAAILDRRDELSRRDFGEDGIMDAVIRVIRHNAEVPGLVRLYASLSVEAADAAHPAHEFFSARYASLRTEIAAELAEKQVIGEIAPGLDVRALATMILALADGLQVQWLLDSSFDMARHVQYLWDLLHRVDGRADGQDSASASLA